MGHEDFDVEAELMAAIDGLLARRAEITAGHDAKVAAVAAEVLQKRAPR